MVNSARAVSSVGETATVAGKEIARVTPRRESSPVRVWVAPAGPLARTAVEVKVARGCAAMSKKSGDFRWLVSRGSSACAEAISMLTATRLRVRSSGLRSTVP